MPPPPPSSPVPDDKLDIIIAYLDRMDRRDRARTWGGFVKFLVSLIPIIILVWSTWYFFAHSDEILSKVTEQAARQAASITQSGSQGISEQLLQQARDALDKRNPGTQ